MSNKLEKIEFNKNQASITPVIKLVQQNLDLNKEIMTNSEMVVGMNK